MYRIFLERHKTGNVGCWRVGLHGTGRGEAFHCYTVLCLLNFLTCECISYLKYYDKNIKKMSLATKRRQNFTSKKILKTWELEIPGTSGLAGEGAGHHPG